MDAIRGKGWYRQVYRDRGLHRPGDGRGLDVSKGESQFIRPRMESSWVRSTLETDGWVRRLVIRGVGDSRSAGSLSGRLPSILNLPWITGFRDDGSYAGGMWWPAETFLL